MNKRAPFLFLALAVLSGLVIFACVQKPSSPEATPLVQLELKNAPEPPESLKAIKRIVCIGDSTTKVDYASYGYTNQLEEYLRCLYPRMSYQVVNAGANGDTSDDIVSRLDLVKLQKNSDLIICMVGVNDIARNAVQAAKADFADWLVRHYRENCLKIIDKAKQKGLPIIMVSPMIALENTECAANKLVGRFTQTLSDLSRERLVLYVDVHHPSMIIISEYRKITHARDLLLTIDGVHPNLSGHRLITNCLLTALGVKADDRAMVQPNFP